MADVDLRLLRYFVAVAEERNFTRAAERLLMTQGALSRAVRSLEAVVGTPLLVRGYREITPTEAGQVLLRQARNLDEQAAEAIRLARRAGTPRPRLRVIAPGCDVSVLERLVTSYHQTDPEVSAEALIVDQREQGDQLREGIADVGLIREPFDERGLDSDELFSEPRVVLLPDHHPLAARSGLELAQLRGLAVIRPGGGREDWFLLWPPEQVASERWSQGPIISDSSQIRALVRLNQAIAFVPESISFAFAGNGVRAVRVLDCPPSTLRIAWRQGSTSPTVAALVLHATLNLSNAGEANDLGALHAAL
ncbi:LysR family transcriptional regulator [Pseudonocardia acaciae]|uniref:LysR family transcriptional regulator n=1 Tax=Pseudonocardia acaciae TaxID=551276 RepID=UPI0007E8CFEC|nr:LysR substrate-binding domain-containing protein [Pseudonocardia acaciae]